MGGNAEFRKRHHFKRGKNGEYIYLGDSEEKQYTDEEKAKLKRLNERTRKAEMQRQANRLSRVNNIRKADRLINNFILSDYSNVDEIDSYLDAIEKRSRQDVMHLDKLYLKGSWYPEEKKNQLREIRKTLLQMAKDTPENVTKVKTKMEKNLKQMQTANTEKIRSLPKEELEKIERDISNMNIGHYVIGYYSDTLKTLADTLGIKTSGRYLTTVSRELEMALGRKLWRGKESGGKFK